MAYTYAELLGAYAALGVSEGRTVYVTSDLVGLKEFAIRGRTAVLDAHFRTLMDLLGPDGTLVVPSASVNLCNTDTPFNLIDTPSWNVGVFSEYVRTRPGALRSFHPFVSYAALGARAEQITSHASRHAFGPRSPEAHMVDLDALSVSVGLHPRLNCSTVHHVEHLMAVPHRYTKEFMHPVVRDADIVGEPFYMHVLYRDSGVNAAYAERIFHRLDKTNFVTSVPVGGGRIHSYSMPTLVDALTAMMVEDIYIGCDQPPDKHPWRC